MQFLKWLAVALVATTAAPSADAWPVRGRAGAQGLAVINYGQNDTTAQSFTNIFKSASSPGFNGGATPAAMGTDGIPIRNFSGIITHQIGPAAQTISQASGWQFKWDAGVSCFRIIFAKAGTTSNPVGSPTILNGSGSGNLTVTGNCGVAGSVDIDWTNTNGIDIQFDGTYTQWNSNTTGQIALVRKSDLTRYANGIYWTQEVVDLLTGIQPESIRFMGANVLTVDGQLITNVVNWSTRKTLDTFSWYGTDYPPSIRCGGTASWCTIVNNNGRVTADPADGTSLAGWVDGEQLQGNLDVTMPGLAISAIGNNGGKCQYTTSTAPLTALSPGDPVFINGINGATECNGQTTVLSVQSTTQFTSNINKGGTTYTNQGWVAYQTLEITGKAGGPKLITNVLWNAFGDGTRPSLTAGTVTFTYNATLDRVSALRSALGNAPPIEVQAQLANLVNANYWYNIPTWSTDDFTLNAFNTAKAYLSSPLKLIAEWGNEIWNGGQDHFFYSTNMGLALGIVAQPGGSQEYYSLRTRQIGSIFAASDWANAMSRVVRTFCFQGGQGGTSGITNPLAGSALASYGYNVFPDRPGDFVDVLCYAPYLSGGWAFSGQSPDATLTPPNSAQPIYAQIVTDTNGGNTAAANATIDAFVRGDAGTNGQTITWDSANSRWQTPLAHNMLVSYVLRFTVTGGNACGNLSLINAYRVSSVPTADSITIQKIDRGVNSSNVSCGTPATGTMSFYSIGGGGTNPYSPYTVFGLANTTFSKYNDLATTGGLSPASATAPYIMRQYEGAPEATGPTDTQCSNLSPSVNATDCATVRTALSNWQNSSLARATMKYYYDAFTGAASGLVTTGTVPYNFGPSQLVLQGGGVYGLNGNASYVSPSLRQTYYGFCDFSGGDLCYRMEGPVNDDDLAREDKHAANDNNPMWLKKAA